MNDLISRQAAIDALKKAYWDKDLQAAKDDPCIIDAMTDWAIRQIKALPSAQPERQHGKWENTRPDAPMFGFYYCSLCGRKRTSPQDRYCPNCGAKMEVLRI